MTIKSFQSCLKGTKKKMHRKHFEICESMWSRAPSFSLAICSVSGSMCLCLCRERTREEEKAKVLDGLGGRKKSGREAQSRAVEQLDA